MHRRFAKFLAPFLLGVAGLVTHSVDAARLAFEHTGRITALSTARGEIGIDGAPYRLARTTIVHDSTRTSPAGLDALQVGQQVGFSVTTGTSEAEVTEIWLLPSP